MDEAELQDLTERAMAALDDGDYVRALGIADQLAAAAPDRAVVRAIRAQALLGTDAGEESLDEARRAAELAPRDAHAHRLLAMAAWRTARLSLAQESFERAIQLSGRRPALLADYAWFMASERGPKPSEDAARAAIAADGESSTAWAALGLAQFRRHHRPEAEASIRRALRLNPKDIYAQSAMLSLLRDRGEDTQAEALAELLGENPGAEDLVALVRDDAKQRRLARMLVERKVDLKELVHEPRSFGWIWLLVAGAFVSTLAYFINPWCTVGLVALTLVLLVAMRRWLD
jgi:Flp pilus assembly protein TadD